MTSTTRNPKDSMKSTWRTACRDQWGPPHWALELLNAHPIALGQKVPVHSKQEKIPYMPQLSLNIWVIVYSFIPLLINQAYFSYAGHNPGPFILFHFYFFSFNAVLILQIQLLRRLGHTYGFLDGDQHERDGVPDVGVAKVASSLYKTTGSRLVLSMYLSYNASQAPMALDWAWLPLQIGLYGIVLDFWFYWYHRLMHDVSFLWKFHRTHHLTKHPNPLMAAYADHEQEFFDMVVIPLMTYLSLKFMGLPLGFYEWWICHLYVAFAEVFGHSGLRIHMTVPSTLSWLLQMFDAEIVIEDHDLHHRKGWRKSHNYGKQTRLWDRIFGTCTERLESVESNVDYTNTIRMPLF
ncbi:fatty acid hydroxylase superfamily protein [Aspergillus ellipticus CBS 707.79]|uniref:Fatty acid hydroxylase superfamily protein n=1 Tax=Aspergillus ellipticus CBS 707.79 TaxID=1448320 RepID=A0A319DMM4_9EURO|nr:fatty acid hydroxylase superfamily protein [Aspergillus ellipticus CBS 707.79]